MLLQRRQRIKTLFGAQVVVKHHPQPLAVKFGFKIKQMHFQQRRMADQRRPRADIGHPLHAPAIGHRHTHRKHASQRQHLPFKLDIGGGKAQLAATLKAVRHPPRE